MKVGVEYSLDGIIWNIKWFEKENIETILYDVGYFIYENKLLYGNVYIKEKFIYEEILYD